MYTLKRLAAEAIPAALEKAERYRLLNDPYPAQSICLDILAVDPDHQAACIMLLLAYTDEFKNEIFPAFNKAVELLERLTDDHCRYYYRGIIHERRANAHLNRGGPSSAQIAYDWYAKAMADYEAALARCSPDNADAALRWNTCARLMNEHPQLKPGEESRDVAVTDGYE